MTGKTVKFVHGVPGTDSRANTTLTTAKCFLKRTEFISREISFSQSFKCFKYRVSFVNAFKIVIAFSIKLLHSNLPLFMLL